MTWQSHAIVYSCRDTALKGEDASLGKPKHFVLAEDRYQLSKWLRQISRFETWMVKLGYPIPSNRLEIHIVASAGVVAIGSTTIQISADLVDRYLESALLKQWLRLQSKGPWRENPLMESTVVEILRWGLLGELERDESMPTKTPNPYTAFLSKQIFRYLGRFNGESVQAVNLHEDISLRAYCKSDFVDIEHLSFCASIDSQPDVVQNLPTRFVEQKKIFILLLSILRKRDLADRLNFFETLPQAVALKARQAVWVELQDQLNNSRKL